MKDSSEKMRQQLSRCLIYPLFAVVFSSAVVATEDSVRSNESVFTQTVHTLELRKSEMQNTRQSRGVKSTQAAIRQMRPLQEFGLGEESHASRSGSVHYPSRLSKFEKQEAQFLEKKKQLHALIFEGIQEDAECEALLSFLGTEKFRPNGQEDLNHLSLKNDALSCLIAHRPLPQGLARHMISIVQDDSEGMIWREYVLQYFGDYYRARWPQPAEGINDLDRKSIQRALAAALFHCDSGLAGTALIVLEDLSSDYPEFDSVVFRRTIRRLALSDESCIATRLTALSMLEDFSDDKDIRQIAELANDSSEQTAIRMVAVGRLAKWSERSNVARAHVEDMATSGHSDPIVERLRGVRFNNRNKNHEQDSLN